MADFLLELLSEEIPARMQDKACTDLARLFTAELARAGLAAAAIETYATPRRLALIARGLPVATDAVSEEVKGPRADAPAQALAGFLGKTGLTREQLVARADAKGNLVLYAVTEKPGRATAAVLAEAVPAIIRGFPWPKSMRWGAESASTASLRWVRPLKGIVALLDEMVVPIEIAGIVAGAATVGHRFHHPDAITIGSADDYAFKLRAAHVILDQEERRRIIRDGAAAVAAAAGLSVVPDEGLVAENAGLTEWPVPLLGQFDPAFLQVPREVIQLTMRTNQKYFALVDAGGALAPSFICTANIVARDGGAGIVAGNAKVLAARLSDAKFFWEQDRKVPLAESAKKLDQIVFHEKLGTVADKVERVAKLARWLVEEGIVGSAQPDRSELADMAETAARLCKADLVTGMVGEFPELQGVMGGYYARAEGYPDAVADAIRDHYKPVGQGDEVPTAPVTLAVSLADKLDSLFGFFSRDLKPTGSKDPFALRRAMLGVLTLVETNALRAPFRAFTMAAGQGHMSTFGSGHDVLLEFAVDRLKVQQKEAGVRHDLIDAVFALGGEDDLVRLLARVHALQAFVQTVEGANLLAGYKRAANILKKESPLPPGEGGARPAQPDGRVRVAALDDAPSPSAADAAPPSPGGRGEDKKLSYTPEPAEAALVAALDAVEPAAQAAVDAEDFGGAMAALSGLRAPIDAFFDGVTVNDPDPVKRAARLALLERIRTAVHRVADFSRIEG
ncbi:MAG TPA: glycine--tRNA ligase subunit beta [Sphingomonas sp.]|jgi:glycyl-tRNA synthetase beta chain|uniref:glycine--tRNA ligase subunit beta n=1 Tax=Sphingomonas sp. TaxID=28214 RepID=UPI002EDB9BD8